MNGDRLDAMTRGIVGQPTRRRTLGGLAGGMLIALGFARPPSIEARSRVVDHERYLRRAVELSKQAVAHGNHPFGALLVDAQGQIVLEQENVEVTERDCTGHAETALMRNASQRYGKDALATYTLYTTAEPCAMCAGAIYWGNVRRVAFGITEETLLALTGADERNPTLNLPCRTVFASGQKAIEVLGPFPAVAEAVLEPHRSYWKPQ